MRRRRRIAVVGAAAAARRGCVKENSEDDDDDEDGGDGGKWWGKNDNAFTPFVDNEIITISPSGWGCSKEITIHPWRTDQSSFYSLLVYPCLVPKYPHPWSRIESFVHTPTMQTSSTHPPPNHSMFIS